MPASFTLSLAHLWFTFCAIAVLEGIAIYTWRFRTEPGALWQSLLQTDKGLWLAALSLARLTTSSSWNETWQILCVLFTVLSVYLWFRFIASLSGFERRAPRWLMHAL